MWIKLDETKFEMYKLCDVSQTKNLRLKFSDPPRAPAPGRLLEALVLNITY